MDLYLIRHGHSESKEPTHETGPTRRPDPGLSARGQREAEALAAWLARTLPHIDALYTSTMRRAEDTAALIASAVGCEVQPDSRLRDFGGNRADGIPYPNDALPPRGPLVAVAQDPYAPLTEDSGESYADLRRRMGLFLRDMTARHLGQTVVAVTHSGAIDAALGNVLNIGPWNRCFILPPWTSITHLRYQHPTEYEPWTLFTMGRTDHLVGLED